MTDKPTPPPPPPKPITIFECCQHPVCLEEYKTKGAHLHTLGDCKADEKLIYSWECKSCGGKGHHWTLCPVDDTIFPD